MSHKAIPVAVNGSNFGNTIISKYKGVIFDFFKFEFQALLSAIRTSQLMLSIYAYKIIFVFIQGADYSDKKGNGSPEITKSKTFKKGNIEVL